MLAIPFGLSDEMIKSAFLDAIASMPNAPLDAAAKSNILKIEKNYALCRVYDFDYQADWSATSIWEHKENYTEYTSKTVFVDDYGVEYSMSGKGHTRAISKVVPETKTRVVRDAVEQTNGSVNGNSREFVFSATTKTLGWVSKLFTQDEIAIEPQEISNEDASKWEAIPELESRKQALESVDNKIHNHCSGEVPGNYYNNLHVNIVENTYTLIEVWLPLIMISFEYGGSEYYLLIKGSKPTPVSATLFLSYPTDQSIVDEKKQSEAKMAPIKQKKKQSLIVSVCLILFILPMLYITSVFQIKIVSTVVTLAYFAAIAFFIYRFFTFRKMVDSAEQEMKNSDAQRRAVRDSVAGIMKRSDLSEEEKKAEISRLLK